MEEELSLRKQEEEKWKLEELKVMEKEFHNALVEETKRRSAREEQLKIEREKKKAKLAFSSSDHWKRATADMHPAKRSKKDGYDSSYYWSAEFADAQRKRTPPVGCCLHPDMTEELKDVKPWVEV